MVVKLPVVYFNGVKSPVDFWLPKDIITLCVLRSKSDNLLSNIDNRKMIKIEFRAPLIDIEEKVKYNNFELKTDEGLKVVWRIYHCRPTKGLIEFDMTIARFVDNIIKMFKYPESSSSV